MKPEDREHQMPNPRPGCPALDDRDQCQSKATCDSDHQCSGGHICCPSACSKTCVEPIE